MAALLQTEQAIFEVARNLPAGEERDAYLALACAADAALHGRVERLLAAYEQGASFLEPLPGWSTAAMIDLPPAEQPGATIGPYKLLEPIGEGGMGIVYVAEQTEPVRRKVALKIIKPGMDTRQVIARFEAERHALAMMDHPNIARILDAGTVGEVGSAELGVRSERPSELFPATPHSALRTPHSSSSGRPYFVMELVRGLAITQYCDEARLQPRQRLELFITVCRAVQHAHQKGIIHRDLKPSNILVTLHDGLPVVKVIDFGVAKAIGQQLSVHSVYTGFTQLIGTPLYMSPEQAELTSQDIDTRSDVYSLGVLLYELLTGHTPFDRATFEKVGFDELRRMIREDDPLRPSQRISTLNAQASSTIARRRGLVHRHLSQALRGELDWIVMKALEKDRTRRYESASALAADVHCYLNNLPIQARPASRWLKARKWRRRHPAAAIAIAAGVLLVMAFATGALWHSHRLGQSLAVSDGLRKEGLEREAELRQELYTNDMRLAWQALLVGNRAETRQLIDRHQEPDASFEWHYLRYATAPPLFTMTHSRDPVLVAGVSPDDRFIASGDMGGEVRIWELETGRLVTVLQYAPDEPPKEVCAVRFSPDGKTLATGGVDRIIHLWNVGDWREIGQLRQHEMSVYGLAWSPDSRWLVSVSRDKSAHVWDFANRRVHQSLPLHNDVIRAVEWSPDGRLLATLDGAKGVRLFETATWNQRGFLDCKIGISSLLCVAFSPDSGIVAASGYHGIVKLFNTNDLVEITSSRANRGLWSLAFWDANHLIGGTGSDGMRIWRFDPEQKSLTVVREGTGSGGALRSIVPVKEGKLLVTASQDDRTIAVWDAHSVMGNSVAAFDQHPIALPKRGVSLVPYRGRKLSVRKQGDGREVARINFHVAAGMPPVPSPREDLLAVLESDGRICIWNTATWQPLRYLDPPPKKTFAQVQFSADSQWLAASFFPGVAGVWNLQTGEWRELFKRDSPEVGLVALSSSRNLLACSVWSEREIDIWDLDRNQRLNSISIDAQLCNLCFLSDDRILAAATHSSDISLLDIASGDQTGTLYGHSERVNALQVAPGGKTLVSASDDGTVRLWSVPSRRELFVLYAQPARVPSLHFTAEQSLIVRPDAGPNLLVFPGNRAAAPGVRSVGQAAH